MKKTTIGNILKVAQTEGKFPVDAETLENFQNNTALTAALGAALGEDLVILTGCAVSGNRRTEGYVYVRLSTDDTGEVLYFGGGNANEPNCYVSEEKSDVVALGETYADAYTVRTLTNGIPSHGEKKLLWSAFVKGSEIFAQKSHTHDISEVKELQTELKNVFVKGMIIMWSGTKNDIPEGWALCDGTNGTPDLIDRFILAANSQGNSGTRFNRGPASLTSNAKTLTVDNLPSHTHTATCASNGSHAHAYTDNVMSTQTTQAVGSGANYIPNPTSTNVTKSTVSAGGHSHNITISSTGKGSSFTVETKIPFYALCFIMKL